MLRSAIFKSCVYRHLSSSRARVSVLLAIPRRMLKGAAVLLALLVVVFFGLTRTEVGREALRVQIEQQFEQRYDGRLTIGKLSGNLVQDVFASNVRLFDGQGRLVAEVDSAVFRPHWRDLIDRTITTGRIYLYRPQLHLVFDADGPNLARIFRRASEAIEEATPWSFRSADIRIIDGSILTTNEGYASRSIERGLVFDFSRARAHAVDGRALVEVSRKETLLDIRTLALELVEPSFRVGQVRGQILVDAWQIDARSLDIRAGGSEAEITATVPYRIRQGDPSPEVELAVRNGFLDHDSLRTLFPALPLADRAAVELLAHGTLESLVLEQMRIERGASRLDISGTLLGLPDRLDYELALGQSRLDADDVSALLPSLDLRPYRRAGMVAGEIYARGEAVFAEERTLRSHRAEGEIRLSSRKGRLRGPFRIGHDSVAGLALHADLRATALRVSDLVDALGNTRTELTGNVSVDLTHAPRDTMRGTAVAALSPSWIGGQRIDSLSLDFDFEGERIAGRGFARQGLATLTASGGYDSGTFRAQALVRDLDAGRWWLRDDSVRTRLNGRLSLEGSARTLADLDARLVAEIDSSSIWHGTIQSLIPAHRHIAHLRQTGDEPYLAIAGDVLELELRSDASIADVRAAVDAWLPALERAVERERARRYRPFTDTLVVEPAGIPPRELALSTPVRVMVEGRVIDSRILSIIYEDLAGVQSDLAVSGDIRADRHGVAVSASVTADSVRTSGPRLDSLRSTFRATLREDSLGRLMPTLAADLRSAALDFAGQHFRDIRASIDFAGGSGRLAVSSSGDAEEERLDVLASIHAFGDVRQLRVERLRLAAAAYEWSLRGNPAIDVFDDAVVIHSLEMQSISARTTQPQRIRIEGVLSADPRDTLSAVIDQVRIGDLSDMVRGKYAMAGVLDGRVSLTGLFDQPEVTGDLDVARFVFDGRPLGHVRVQSMYVAGEPDITLDATVRPLEEDEGAAPLEEIPAGATANDLRLFGTFRLPVPASDAAPADPGRLDLALSARHADAFFFDYIFKEIAGARGVLQGTGSIGGHFRKPIFNADLTLDDGGMRIPNFNLAYDVEGRVTVDSAAIRLQQVRVDDATGGRAIVDGDILFNDYRFFSFDLRANLDETQFMNVLSSREMGFYGDVRASGNVTLTGPLDRASLTSNDATIHPDSRVYIAIMEESGAADSGFIVFADSSGSIPDMSRILRRAHVLSKRPAGERMFVDGLEMDLNILASQGTNLHLVIDPVLGDVINATASGRIQLQRSEGDFSAYGTMEVNAGDYLFTAGDVFVRRFLIDGGSITWDGDPANAVMDIQASYRTRASAAGLNIAASDRTRIPLIVRLDITGRVAAPSVGLRLLIDRDTRETITAYESLESILNQPERSAEYATSVMLTNSFLLTTSVASSGDVALATTRNQLAFNSLSQLVATQLNRYLNHALPNIDVSLGLQGESTQDLDVTYGVALRLLDERLVIRGQGLYQNEAYRSAQQNVLDEFIVEVRLSSSVSVEVFYRREDDILGSDHALANTTGAGLSYETQFSSWSRLMDRLLRRRGEKDATEPVAREEILAGADDDTSEDGGED